MENIIYLKHKPATWCLERIWNKQACTETIRKNLKQESMDKNYVNIKNSSISRYWPY